MQLSGTSLITQTANVLNPTLVSRSSTGTSSDVTALPPIPNPQGGAGPPVAAAPSPPPAAARTTHAAQVRSGTSGTVANSQVTAYSTTVAGTNYTGTVEEADGEYVASDPTLAGATATGSSIEAAEYNLDARIEEIV